MNDDVNESQKAIIFRLGCAVFNAQLVEFVICGTVLALKDAELGEFTAEDFFSGDPNKRGPMLGKLVGSLKRVADFDPDLADRLDRFVKLRNRVVHKLFFEAEARVPPSPERDAEIRKNIESLISECNYMRELFLGFVGHLPVSEGTDPEVAHFLESVEHLKTEGRKIVDAVRRKKQRS